MQGSTSSSLQLPQELTYRQGRACLQYLRSQVAAHSDALVVVDASAVKVFDSAALAVLLACRRTAQEVGKQLVVQGLPKGLQSMAVLYGVDRMLLPPATPTAGVVS